MKELISQILIISYGATGAIGIMAYLPTIKDLYHHKKASANITSYALWTMTSCIGLLYAIFVLSDSLLRIVSGLHFLSCITVLSLSIGLVRRMK